MIKFNCPNCAKPLSARPELAGNQSKCKCGYPVTIPNLIIESDPTLLLEDDQAEDGIVPAAIVGQPVQTGNENTAAPKKPLETTCPFCNSSEIQKASAIYTSGTSHSTSTTESHSRYHRSGATSVVYRSGSHTTSEFHQTELANRATPPIRRDGASRIFWRTFWRALAVLGVGLFITAYTKWRVDLENFYLDLTELFMVPDDWMINDVGWAYIFFAIFGAFLIAMMSLPWGIRNSIWNRTKFVALMLFWRRQWYCHKCGSFFI